MGINAMLPKFNLRIKFEELVIKYIIVIINSKLAHYHSDYHSPEPHARSIIRQSLVLILNEVTSLQQRGGGGWTDGLK